MRYEVENPMVLGSEGEDAEVIDTCYECGEEFYDDDSAYQHGDSNYCSIECIKKDFKVKSVIVTESVKCSECGHELFGYDAIEVDGKIICDDEECLLDALEIDEITL